MNINLNFLKRKKNFKKGGLHISPDVYWSVIQISALVLILGAFTFSFFLFKQINEGLASSALDTTNPTNSINKDRIEKVLKYFDDKNTKSLQIINSPATVVDPSQ